MTSRKTFSEQPALIAIINILVSIITGLIFNFGIKIQPFEAFALSLLLLFSLSIIQLIMTIYSIRQEQLNYFNSLPIHINIQKLSLNEDVKSHISGIILHSIECLNKYSALNKETSINDLFSERVILETKNCHDNLMSLYNGYMSVISSTQSDKLWKVVISKIAKNFFTTNISYFDGLLGKEIDQNLLNLQGKTCQKIPGEFVRIFVYKDKVQLLTLSKIIKAQTEVGIVIGCISKTEFDFISDENGFVLEIMSPDFSIIDNNFLYVTHIDNKSGKVARVEISTNAKRLKAAKTFSDTLMNYAEYPGTKL